MEVYFQFKVKKAKVGSLLPIDEEIWYDNGNMIINLTKGEKMYIRDNYLSKLISFKDTDFIKVITGVRRSGKSVL